MESNDTLGAGSYSEPSEYKEKNITGKIVATFDLDALVPYNWDSEDVKNDIEENLKDYVDLCDYIDLDIDLSTGEKV